VSLRDFWTSVQSAARMVAPRAFEDSPKLDASRIEHTLRKSNHWLTPSAIEGFDPAEFSFLSEEERRALSDSVARFLQVAESVPANAPPTETQVAKALPHFARIVEILRPDKYSGLDAFVLGKQLERSLNGKLPAWVRELRFESGTDATGDRGLWIWVEVDDSAVTGDDAYTQNLRPVINLLETTVRRLSPDWWPYVHIRTVSEQQAVSR